VCVGWGGEMNVVWSATLMWHAVRQVIAQHEASYRGTNQEAELRMTTTELSMIAELHGTYPQPHIYPTPLYPTPKREWGGAPPN
jgi:hypothetical protein